MAICPNGHDSASEDFCDICGMRIAASPSPASTAGRRSSGPSPAMGTAGAGPGAAGAGEPCPRCSTPRVGQFCEACGHNFAAAGQSPWPPAPTAPPTSPPRPVAPPPYAPAPYAAAPYAPAVWTAVVSSDRAYYDSVQAAASGPDAASVPFPGYYAERRFRLAGSQMRIGRRSVSRGIDPEIDLTGPPVDPGISRLHAVLIARPDGNWMVLDPGSANGTLVNGTEIPTGVQVPLRDGDRINLGGWTAITVHCG